MNNDYHIIEKDIIILCVKSVSFPEGIQNAFNDLKQRIPKNDKRMPYGISKPEMDGTIVYRAGVEESYPGEAAATGCESLVLKNGKYIFRTVSGWQTKMETIGNVFGELLNDPRLDPASPCVELYRSQTELICMVRIDETKMEPRKNVPSAISS